MKKIRRQGWRDAEIEHLSSANIGWSKLWDMPGWKAVLGLQMLVERWDTMVMATANVTCVHPTLTRNYKSPYLTTSLMLIGRSYIICTQRLTQIGDARWLQSGSPTKNLSY